MKILNYSNEILAAILGILGDNEVELSVCCWSKLLLTFSLQFAIEGDGTCTRVASIDCPVFRTAWNSVGVPAAYRRN